MQRDCLYTETLVKKKLAFKGKVKKENKKKTPSIFWTDVLTKVFIEAMVKRSGF